MAVIFENSAGRVVDSYGGICAYITDFCGLTDVVQAEKIADTDGGNFYCWINIKGVTGQTKVTVDETSSDAHRELRAAYTAAAAEKAAWYKAEMEKTRARKEAEAAGSVLVRVEFLRSEGDGWERIYVDAEGRELRSPEVVREEGRQAWVTAEEHAKLTEKPAPSVVAAAATEAEPLKPVPAAAVAAYRKYKGDADAAWEAEDESAWGLIRLHGERISKGDLR